MKNKRAGKGVKIKNFSFRAFSREANGAESVPKNLEMVDLEGEKEREREREREYVLREEKRKEKEKEKEKHNNNEWYWEGQWFVEKDG
jgi:hypothetical protein